MFCTIQLSKSDPTPLYIQLANELAKLINSEQLPAHTKLPTIRSLSRKLSINRDTVVSAYKVLENRGLILAYVGNGTYVSPKQTLLATPVPSAIPCSSLGFCKDIFPTSILQSILTDVVTTEGWQAFADPLHREKNRIREAIVSYFTSLGLETTSAEVRLLHDFTSFLLELLKLHPNSCICVEAHHDLTYTSFLRSLGVKLIEIPLTPNGICIKTLEEVLEHNSVSFVCISTYAQNPTGISYDDTTKTKLLNLASSYDFYILEDGTYSDFSYTTECLKPLYQLDHSSHIIYIYHFSKLYLPYLHYSFVALPKQLATRLADSYEYTLNERVLYFYLQSEVFHQLRIDLIQNTYNYFKIIKNILFELNDVLDTYTLDTGLFFWIKPLNHSVSQISSIFLKNHLIISPGEIFSFKTSSSYFRLSLSQLTPDSLPLLIKSLYDLKKAAN